MDCRNCEYMKKFQRMSGGKAECQCCHEKAENLPVEWFGNKGVGFICYVDKDGDPRIKSHPRWCPLRTGRAGKYVAEWDGEKGKIALKFKEDKDGASTEGNQSD